MNDTISRQATLDIALKYCPDDDGTCSEAGSDMRNMLDEIEALPPAEPESAQWVQMLINRHMYKCSNCHVAWNKRLVFDADGNSKNIFMKYCPCCGRKMQTEVDYE